MATLNFKYEDNENNAITKTFDAQDDKNLTRTSSKSLATDPSNIIGNYSSSDNETIISPSSNCSDEVPSLTNSGERVASAPAVNIKGISYTEMISKAIFAFNKNAFNKNYMCTLQDIYKEMIQQYPDLLNRGKSWKNSVRHTLSLNECFLKIPRQGENRGKCCFWTIHPCYLERFLKGDFHKHRKSGGDRRSMKHHPVAFYFPLQYNAPPHAYHPYNNTPPHAYYHYPKSPTSMSVHHSSLYTPTTYDWHQPSYSLPPSDHVEEQNYLSTHNLPMYHPNDISSSTAAYKPYHIQHNISKPTPSLTHQQPQAGDTIGTCYNSQRLTHRELDHRYTPPPILIKGEDYKKRMDYYTTTSYEKIPVPELSLQSRVKTIESRDTTNQNGTVIPSPLGHYDITTSARIASQNLD